MLVIQFLSCCFSTHVKAQGPHQKQTSVYKQLAVLHYNQIMTKQKLLKQNLNYSNYRRTPYKCITIFTITDKLKIIIRRNRSTNQTSFDVHFMENIIVQRATSFRLCGVGGKA